MAGFRQWLGGLLRLAAPTVSLRDAQKTLGGEPVVTLAIGAHTLSPYVWGYTYEEDCQDQAGLTLWLDNRQGRFNDLAGDWPDLKRGAAVDLRRGLRINGVAYTEKLPRTWIEGLRYVYVDGAALLRLSCIDWWGRLRRFRYAEEQTWEDTEVASIAAEMLGQVGLDLTSGSFSFPTDFTVSPRRDLAQALSDLIARVDESLYTGLDGVIYHKTLDPAEASGYSYAWNPGAGNGHPLLPGTEVAQTSPRYNRVVVIGGSAKEYSGSAEDASEIALVGTRLRTITDKQLASNAQCEERARAELRFWQAQTTSATIVARPHFTLRMYDVVDLEAPPWGGPAASGRVLHIKEEYAKGEGLWQQTISIGGLAGLGIGAAELEDGAVGTPQLIEGAVTADEVAAGAITAGKLAAGAIEAGAIAAGSITADKIAADAVTAEKIAADAVTADKIKAGAVSATKIAADAVTAEKIAADAVEAGKIKAGAITATKIASGAVEADKIAADAVTAGKIAAGAITATKIASGAVEADKIASGAVTAGKIGADSITASNIQVGTLTMDRLVIGAMSENLVQDAGFESGSLATVHAYENNGGTWSVQSSVYRSGAYALAYNASGQTAAARFYLNGHPTAAGYLNRHVSALEGREFTFEFYGYRPTSDTYNAVRVYFRWYNSSGVSVGSNYATFDPASWSVATWTLCSASRTAPGGVAYVVFELYILNDGNARTLYFDDILARARIGASLIQAEAVTAEKIAASAVTADKLSVSTLSAITANMGTLTAGTIKMGTGTKDSNLTGFQLDSSELVGQNNGVDQVVLSSSDGRITAGAGAVVLSADGIHVTSGNADVNKHKIRDGTNTIGALFGELQTGTGADVTLEAVGKNSSNPEAYMEVGARTYNGAAHGGVASITLSLDTGTGVIDMGGATRLRLNTVYLEMTEQSSDPSAPGSNRGRLYLRDNGSGKTQLCIRFNTGAVQVIATEP